MLLAATALGIQTKCIPYTVSMPDNACQPASHLIPSPANGAWAVLDTVHTSCAGHQPNPLLASLRCAVNGLTSLITTYVVPLLNQLLLLSPVCSKRAS